MGNKTPRGVTLFKIWVWRCVWGWLEARDFLVTGCFCRWAKVANQSLPSSLRNVIRHFVMLMELTMIVEEFLKNFQFLEVCWKALSINLKIITEHKLNTLYFNSGSVYAVELGPSSAPMLFISIVSLLLLKRSQFQRLLVYFQKAVIRSAALTPLNPFGGRGVPRGCCSRTRTSSALGLSLRTSSRGPCLAGFLHLPDLCAGNCGIQSFLQEQGV